MVLDMWQGVCKKRDYPWFFMYYFLILLCLIFIYGCTESEENVFTENVVVTSLKDSGEGTLRWALETAAPGETITFDSDVFSPGTSQVIYVRTELPLLNQGNLSIIADSAVVIIDGLVADSNTRAGLVLNSNDNVVSGLQIRNFKNGAGILVDKGAQSNIIGPENIIYGNGTYGVYIAGDNSSGNTITRCSIYNNGIRGINISESAASHSAPVISDYNIERGLVRGTAVAESTVEFFSDRGGEGKIFEGNAVADENGNFELNIGSSFEGPRLTATATDENGSTSYFSEPTGVREIIVTNPEDSGDGSLRQVINDAQNGDIIVFDSDIFPPADPVTINVDRPYLLDRARYITIDASNAGVVLDGSSAMSDCFHIHSNGNMIMGLQIVNFEQGVGIVISGGASGNIIGGERSKGDSPLGQGNLISGNDTGIGIWDNGTSSNLVTGNLIGTDLSGEISYHNGANIDGVSIGHGAKDNIVGPNNIIAFNSANGIVVNGSSTVNNTITGNSIHGSGYRGIFLEGGNKGLPAPTIISFELESGFVQGQANPNSIVEIFSDYGSEGKIYEAMHVADEDGNFSITADRSFSGEGLTATITDPDGNTSSFSAPTSGSGTRPVLQAGNNNFLKALNTLPSNELADNRIGTLFDIVDEPGYLGWENQHFVDVINEIGMKRIRLLLDFGDSPMIDWSVRQESTRLTEKHISTIKAFHESGIEVMCGLIYWDIEADGKAYTSGYARFRDEQEIERFAQFARDTARQLKGNVSIYQLLNEPNIDLAGEHRFPSISLNSPQDYYDLLNEGNPEENIHLFRGIQQDVTLPDYINMASQVIPVIKAEDPEAKVAIGAVGGMQEGWHASINVGYLMGLLESDISALADVVTFHPLYNITPQNSEIQERYVYEPENMPPFGEVLAGVPWPPSADVVQNYYDNYPDFLREVRAKGEKSGFKGEIIVDEITYWHDQTGISLHYPAPPIYFTQNESAKYVSRAIIMHLGMDMTALVGGFSPEINFRETIVTKNLCTVMAGHEAIRMPLEIDTDYRPLAYATFRFPEGERMLAVWTDEVAKEEDPGVPAVVTFPGLQAKNVTGIDILNSVKQDLAFEISGDSTIIKDFMIKDYPMLLILDEPVHGPGYSETPGDGFVRLY